MKSRRNILLYSLLFSFNLSLLSCNSDVLSKNPPIIIIALDKFGFSDINCNNENTESSKSAFDTFCSESVRYTHAFTTSTLNQAAMGSILTGLYPFQHGLIHNGDSQLDANIKNIAVEAAERNYATAFFSGGPPLLRKSNLQRGFEVFDDRITISSELIYNPIRNTTNEMIDWIDDLPKNKPFLSILYAPDLNFPSHKVKNELGEIQPNSFESQFDEIDSVLFKIISHLKKKQLWDKSLVVLTGLRAKTDNIRKYENPNTNLYSENTQVALFIKPPRKKRDLGISWKIDQNVSLADLGKTLFSFLSSSPTIENPNFPTISLKDSLEKSNIDWLKNRPLLVETSWLKQFGNFGTRYGIRSEHLLFIYDQNSKIYNSLIDRLETQLISLNDSSFSDEVTTFSTRLKNIGASSWNNKELENFSQYFISNKYWMKSNSRLLKQELYQILEERPQNSVIKFWLADLVCQNSDWENLEAFSTKYGLFDFKFIAQINLNKTADTSNIDSCLLSLFKKPTKLSKCNNVYASELLKWQQTKQKNIPKSLYYHFLDKEITLTNMSLNGSLSLSSSWKLGSDSAKLALYLPDYQQYKNLLIKSVEKAEDDDSIFSF